MCMYTTHHNHVSKRLESCKYIYEILESWSIKIYQDNYDNVP